MSKRYKLLKDIPYHKAGEEFHFYQVDGADWVHGSESSNHAPGTWTNAFVTDLHEYEQWFEPLNTPTQRWRAEDGSKYYIVSSEIAVSDTYEDGDIYDGPRFRAGNYFRTKESAQAAAEAIEALLEYIHNADLSMPFAENEAHAWPLVKAAEAARAAVIEETE